MKTIRAILPALAATTTLAAADGPAPVDGVALWREKVSPLLASSCIECHGAKKAKRNLRLDSREGILKGGRGLGPAVVPGKPDESPLLKVCLLPRDDELAMPPKEALKPEQIGWLRAWIAAGAPME